MQNLEAFEHHPSEQLRAHSSPHFPRVLIIVPARNEGESLPSLIRELKMNCAGYDVVIIDDGSTDNTASVAQQMAVGLVRLSFNLGIGGAVQTGLQIAHREGYDIAIQVDGDGQHPPKEIRKLVTALLETNSDIVVGSRFKINEGYQSTLIRRIGIRLFSFWLSRLCRTPITDPTSGFRAMNRHAIQLLAQRYSEDYPEVEALLIAHDAGLKIRELSVQMAKRQGGRSSIGKLQSISYMVKVPLTILMHLLRGRPSARKEQEY
jgi:glycosyltransferase involved in cell wall biosynthesis